MLECDARRPHYKAAIHAYALISAASGWLYTREATYQTPAGVHLGQEGVQGFNMGASRLRVEPGFKLFGRWDSNKLSLDLFPAAREGGG